MANVGIPAPPQNQDEGAPLLGLYLDRPAWKIDPRGFSACNNVRIEMGRVRSDLMGWQKYITTLLNGPVIYIGAYSYGATQIPIAVTPTDLYRLDQKVSGSIYPYFITPIYDNGTIAVNNGSNTVTGTNTRWASDIQFGDVVSITANASAGATTISVGAVTAYTGLVVTCPTTPGAVAAGTYLASIGAGTVTLSQGLASAVTSSDTLKLGSGITLRQIAKVGDQISFGNNSQHDPAATWYTVTAVGSDTSLTISPAYSGTNLSGAVYTLRELLTNETTTGLGSYTLAASPVMPDCMSANFPNNLGESTYAGDQWLFTNGVDPVVIFSLDGTGTTTYARSVPFVCNALLRYKNLMLYGGLTLPGPVLSFMSLASSDNGAAFHLAGGVSFQGVVGDGPFTIKRMGILGSSLIMYAFGVWAGGIDAMGEVGGCVISGSFLGFPTIWAFSTIIQNRGPLAAHAVAEFPDRHQFLSLDGEYRYNGLFIQIMNDQVWRQVLKNYDPSRESAANCMVVPTFGDILWQIPRTDDPAGQLYASTAYVEAYMEQANSYLFKPFTQRSLPFLSIGTELGASMPLYLAGDASGQLWQLYTSNTANGVPLTTSVTWGFRVLGNARARALVKRVYPEIEYIAAGGSVSVTLTCYDALGGPAKVTDTQTFNPNYSGNRFTTHYRRGRMASVTISDTAGLGWVCDGYDLDWVDGGLR